MKNLFLIAISAFTMNMFAQPVISNGNNIPTPGLTAPVYYGTATAGVGAAGANQTWNFSAITFSPIGTLTTINPSASTYSASFPMANYAYSLSGMYSYFDATSTKMEVLAYSISSPGSGNDFTPNPRTVLKFPFNYTDSQPDTWQKVGGTVNSVTITYDGYGTLITPASTYSNVVRVKEDYGNGSVDYQWYILNPLMSILAYNNSSNTLYLTNATAITGVKDNKYLEVSVSMYPNPVSDKLTIEVSDFLLGNNNLSLNLLNAFGQVMKQVSINSVQTNVDLNITSGIYLYQILDKNNILKTGKVIVE
ncbi:MAG: hypothetical protein JWO32_1268 [Bacteroidetes bacterium]|nr:hypothetical protein [Bacteroidota bacterium]